MNKQVEEMAKDICPFHEYENCEQCDTELDIGDEPCLYKMMAKEFIEKDYRRALDVAREIIDDILEALQGEIDAEDKLETTAWNESDTVGYHIHQYAEDKLDTLKIAFSLYKKKYESEGEE